ncbi:hypothetical protein IH601_04215, partial [Candidatus Bipolaricaulota bacterium]|nr:hypothetical protein [Candidatus Bipolaricaulota bacterium]
MERRLWASARHLQTVGLSVLVILAVVGMVGLAIDIDPVEDPGTINVVLTYNGTPLHQLGLTYNNRAAYVQVVGSA